MTTDPNEREESRHVPSFISASVYSDININGVLSCSWVRDLVNKGMSNTVLPGKWKLQTWSLKVSKGGEGKSGWEEEHPRKVSIVDLETTSSHLPRRLRWMGRNADRREGCGWTNGWTDSRAHRWRVVQSEKGCQQIPMALHRRELQPYRRLCAPDGYRGATRVVAGGGATSIGGLLPVVLAMLLTEGWIGARFYAHRSAAPRTGHMRHAAYGATTRARFLCFCVRHFSSRYFPAREIDIVNLDF